MEPVIVQPRGRSEPALWTDETRLLIQMAHALMHALEGQDGIALSYKIERLPVRALREPTKSLRQKVVSALRRRGRQQVKGRRVS